MKRLLAGVVLGASLTLGLSGCFIVQAPPSFDPNVIDPTPSTTTPIPDVAGSTADCTHADIRLTEANATYTLTGECGIVTIEGADITVDAGNLEGLVVRGDRITVEAAAVGSIKVSGTENTITVDDAGAISINGDRNRIRAFTVYTVDVSGNDNVVAATSTGDVTQSGARNTIGR
jgi:hypothetical protein